MLRKKLLNCFKRLIFTTLLLTTLCIVNYYGFRRRYDKLMYSRKSIITPKSKANIATARSMKNILLWTDRTKFPFIYFGEGSSVFEDKKCKITNCYVTGERYLLGDYTKFDLIVFNGPQMREHLSTDDLPQYRSPRQKYVFANIEAAANYRMCSNTWNGYFNWTWTYKLNSDAVWGYFIIKNVTNHVIGPGLNVPWIKFDNMEPIDDLLKTKLKTKKQSAAWFVSNCYTKNRREEYVRNITIHLSKYNLVLDVYGDCGKLQCPKEIMNRCLKFLQNNYYFYFAFENAFSEDYVTEKVLHALNYNTVPVVLGGANYSRFLPPGSYLDALSLGPEKLAETMHEAILNPSIYYKFFRWKKYYSFHYRHESPSTDDYCHFCAMANDERLMNTTSVHANFDTWWEYLTDCNFAL